jgi:hypothetical protein
MTANEWMHVVAFTVVGIMFIALAWVVIDIARGRI